MSSFDIAPSAWRARLPRRPWAAKARAMRWTSACLALVFSAAFSPPVSARDKDCVDALTPQAVQSFLTAPGGMLESARSRDANVLKAQAAAYAIYSSRTLSALMDVVSAASTKQRVWIAEAMAEAAAACRKAGRDTGKMIFAAVSRAGDPQFKRSFFRRVDEFEPPRPEMPAASSAFGSASEESRPNRLQGDPRRDPAMPGPSLTDPSSPLDAVKRF